MFLLFVFYRGFLRKIQYYMFLLFTSYKRFSAVLKLTCFISKSKERLVGQLRCSQKYANAGGACCSNKTIICQFPSGLKAILLKVGAQSTREVERRSCETRKWACSNLCKSFISPQEIAEKKSQIIFITTCYRLLITFCRRKTVNVNEQMPSCCSCLERKLCIF